MSNTLKNFYDELYKANPGVFGDSSLVSLERMISGVELADKRALDIGAGEGRTSNYLAQKGFIVDAVDFSDGAFSAVEETANVHPIITQAEKFDLQNDYGIVLLFLVVHHIRKEDFVEFVSNLHIHTTTRGLHCYRIFTTNSDFYKNDKEDHFFEDGQNLNELYTGWDILFDRSFVSKASTSDAKNEVREVVYRKV